ncbi:hypothetical protein L6164_003060 [Bauhinia variegata]|uniref:Uncharacterized protein n=1 Tax=Bauhinia variegata TaxID=167791 RepID=A0ACB9Q2A5_BAUVA|nr:hypothetical protein L6164_003060 [Bauhinia variegata]
MPTEQRERHQSVALPFCKRHLYCPVFSSHFLLKPLELFSLVVWMMAEQIPYCIAVSMIHRLSSSDFQEIGRIYGVMGEFEKLTETVESIKAVLVDAEEKQQENHAVQNWIRKMKTVLHEADDLFDDFVIENFQHEVDDSGEKVRKVRGFHSSSDKLDFSCEIAHKIEAIQKKFNDVSEDMSNLNFLQREISTKQNEGGERVTSSLMSESSILEKESIMPVLKRSYNNLSPALKQCFAYCSLYPKDWKIEKEELIQLWMAQGYLDCSNDKKHVEPRDIGDEYVNIFLMRSFFQDVEMNELGGIACFKMHPLMHELAKLVAGSDCYVDSEGMIVGNPMHISFERKIIRSPDTLRFISRRHSNFIRSLDTLDAKSLRSILRLDRGILLHVNSLSTVSDFTCLRVFALPFSSLTELPNSFGELKHLRYLDLSHCSRLTGLPETISNLVFLQTLKLSYCRRLDISVEIFTNLTTLRHLVVDSCKAFESGMPVSLGELKSLQQLPTFYVGDVDNPDRRVGKLNGLKWLNELKGHLGIENLHLVKDVESESEEVNLKEKKCISSLSLHWRCDSNEVSCKNSNPLRLLENLCPPQNLKIFGLFGYPGLRLSSWISSLANIVRITIMSCDNCQHLPPLEQLPSLKYLKIWQMDALEYMHCEWPQEKVPSFSSASSLLPMPTICSFFPSLERLDIRRCPNLKGWKRMSSVVSETDFQKHQHEKNQQQEEHLSLPPFPCLSSLSISICPNLACMPTYPLVEKFDLRFGSSMKPLIDTLEMKTKNEQLIAPQDKDEPEQCAVISSWCKSSSCTPLSNLKSLSIQDIDIESLPEEWMKNLTCLKMLSILAFPRLAPMFRYMQHLPSPLEKLEFVWVDNFDMLNDGDEIENIGTSTQCQVPQCLLSLQTIEIDSCQHLKALPEWICNLTSIQHMTISRCNNLDLLPEGMHGLANLQKLEIIGCPLLKERCKRETGADWPKIAHVQDISIHW